MINHLHRLYTLLTVLLLAGLIGNSCTPEKIPVYSLTSSVEPADAGTVIQSSSKAEEGSTIALTISSNQHWAFTGWSGDIDESNKMTVDVVMDRDRHIIAHFEKREYPVNVDIVGEGEILKEIISEKSVSTGVQHASILKLIAKPKFGWHFSGWSGKIDSDQSEIEIEIDGPIELTATFVRSEFPLTVNVEGNGTVSQEIVQAKSTKYPFQSVVQLTAVPEDGWRFANWSGDAEGSDNTLLVEMNDEKQITAHFERKNYDLNVQVNGKGTVTQSVVSAKSTQYPFQTQVQLDAKADSGWEFSNWSGDVTGKNATVVINIDKPRNVTATFLKIPGITTSSISKITSNSAVSGGVLSNSSNVNILQMGLCWSTSPDTNPVTNSDMKCETVSTSSSFEVTMSNLKPSTRYYVRAVLQYSINSDEMVLGNERQFTTKEEPVTPPPADDNGGSNDGGSEDEKTATPPTVSTTTIDSGSITSNSARSGGTVSSDGGSTVTARGLCWNTSPNPSLENNVHCTQHGSGTGSFSTTMTDLIALNNYWVRAYATNAEGTTYGNEVSFTTQREDSGNDTPPPPADDDSGSNDDDSGEETTATPPSVSTTAIDSGSITTNSANSGGTVTSDGGSTVTVRGLCWNTSPYPTLQNNVHCTQQGSGTGSFSTTMTGLIALNNYWVRAYATNSEGTTYGNQVSFTTKSGTTTPPPTDDGGGSNDGDDDTPPPPPPPGSGTTTLLVMFSPSTLANSGTATGAIDVNVNGTWHNFSSSFPVNSSLADVGYGVVLNVSGPVTSLSLRQSQIRKPGLNNDCYGFTTLKLMQKHPDFNAYSINGNPGSPSYWAGTYDGKGQLVERGSINYLLDQPNANFYQQSLPSSWTSSGKFMLWVDGVGVNHGGYLNHNNLLGAPGLYPTGRTTALPACSGL